MQFMARIAKDRGDEDAARRIVERLLSIDPTSTWAQRALKSFSGTSDNQAGSKGRRFWKRGS